MTTPPEPPAPPPSEPPPPPASPYGAGEPPYQPYQPAPAPRRRTWLWIALAAVGVLVVLAVIGAVVSSGGDGSSHVTAASAGPTDASGATTVRGNGISISVPAGWKAVPLDSNDLQSFLDTATKDNPQMAQVLGDQVKSMVSKNVQFFAFKMSSLSSGFGDNVSVLTVPSPGNDLDAISAAVKVQLSGIGATDVTTERATYPQGEAVKANYSYSMNVQGQSVDLSGEQVYLPIGNQVAIVTLTTTNRSADEPAFEAMARSLQLT